MASFINQFSFLIMAAVVLVAAAVFLLRQGVNQRALIGLGVLALSLGAAWLLARPAADAFASADAVRAEIGAGQPVVLEYQSEY